MNSDVKVTTAKIYQFPQRAQKAPTLPAPKIVFGSCWYHDDAIQSEPKPIKPAR
jgi:Protein of unknown function (DUF2735)